MAVRIHGRKCRERGRADPPHGAQLLLVHHPLLLRGVTSVAPTTYKGRIVHRLIRAGVGLFTAHTNADVANPGVSDALAERLRALRIERGLTHEQLAKEIGQSRAQISRLENGHTFGAISGAGPRLGVVDLVRRPARAAVVARLG